MGMLGKNQACSKGIPRTTELAVAKRDCPGIISKPVAVQHNWQSSKVQHLRLLWLNIIEK